MSSSESISSAGMVAKTRATDQGTQLIEHPQGLTQEFRESGKISFLEETRTDTNLVYPKTSFFAWATPAVLKYANSNSQYILRNPSKRLFLSLGALII